MVLMGWTPVPKRRNGTVVLRTGSLRLNSVTTLQVVGPGELRRLRSAIINACSNSNTCRPRAVDRFRR
jgi:hypothetical protein